MSSSRATADEELEADLFGYFGFECVEPVAPLVSEAETESVAPLPRFRGLLRFYVVCKVGSKPTPLQPGVWCHKWSLIGQLLPEQKLFGSGVTLIGFNDLDSAILYVQGRCNIHDRAAVEIFAEQDCEDAFRTHRM